MGIRKIKSTKEIIYAKFPFGKIMLTKRDREILRKLIEFKKIAPKNKYSLTQIAKELGEPNTTVMELMHKLNGHEEFIKNNETIYEKLYYLHQHIMPIKKIYYPTFVVLI